MKTFLKCAIYAIASISLLSSCDEEVPDVNPDSELNGCYIINYGSWGNGGASVSKFDYEKEVVSNSFYLSQNNLELGSNLEYAGLVGDSVYFLGNDADQIFTTNKLIEQKTDGVTEGLGTPRYFEANEDYLYISCWNNPTFADYGAGMPNSTIVKFNIENKEVESTFALPGGPEGLAIANGNLYVALNFIDSIAVLDLATEELSYIPTPAVSSYFIKDDSDNLYVTFVSTYYDPSSEDGLGYINTATNTLEESFILNGVSIEYAQILSANNDISTLYLLAAQWIEESTDNWVQKGAAYTFDVATKTFTEFAGNLEGVKGIVSNPINNDVYLLSGTSATEGGKLSIYNEDGTFVKDEIVGISPTWAFFLD